MSALQPPLIVEAEQPTTLRIPPPKLPRIVVPPSLPTGTPAVRFLKRAIAANAPLVAVNGALTHLGSHVVAHMLSHGYYVRAVVPQGADADFLRHLPGADTRLYLVPVRDPAADDALPVLLVAFRGVSTVIHMPTFATSASAGAAGAGAAARRVVPALKLALDAASTPGQLVTNFIYLSNEATVYDPRQHRPRRAVARLSETNWFDCSRSARHATHPHAYAHTVAELRLWARVGAGRLPFNVTSVIPAFVLGPILTTRHVPASPPLALFAAAARGDLPDVPDIPFPPVDVRDVASAVAILAASPHISGRILLSAQSLTTVQLFDQARKHFPFFSWPASTRSKRVSLFSRTAKAARNTTIREPESTSTSTATTITDLGATTHPTIAASDVLKSAHFATRDRIGRSYAFSQARARHELGVQFRPVVETVRDTLKSLQRFNVIPIHHPPQRRNSGPVPSKRRRAATTQQTSARRKSMR